VLQKEFPAWREHVLKLIAENPTWGEVQVSWKLIEDLALKASRLLLPVFEREKGQKGCLSIQTNPTYYRDADAMAAQATYFGGLAPNIHSKIPATRAGIAAMEEVTYQGVNINATVCFTVPQAVAAAEAVERGLSRRERAGLDSTRMIPVCTIMIGRLDDWIKVVATKKNILTTPGHLDWAGIAAIKKAYGIFQQRGYRTRLLAAAYRHHLHWSELIGGNLTLNIPYDWQVMFNQSDVEVKERMQNQVDPQIIDELCRKFPEFRRAYSVDGMTVDEFDSYGATVRTLRSFIGSYHELLAFVRESMLPDPDKK
jgi:transaldolase